MSGYKVKDLYLASYLYSQGFKLMNTERIGSICWFVFDQELHCKQLSEKYWAREANCEPKSFVDAIQTLKDIIFSQ